MGNCKIKILLFQFNTKVNFICLYFKFKKLTPR